MEVVIENERIVPEELIADKLVKNIQRDIYFCKQHLEREIGSSHTKSKIFNVIKYISLAVSLGLDFAPAFLQILQANWYSIPTVSFTLICLLVDIYQDKADYSSVMKEDYQAIRDLTSIQDSIIRKLSGEGKISEEYVKRMQEKLALIKAHRMIPEQE